MWIHSLRTLFIIVIRAKIIESCQRTVSSTPAVTTTTVATTTTANPACVNCSLNAITLTPGSTAAGTSTPTAATSTDANGCLVLTVTCTAQAGGMTFMQFNTNQGGPTQPIGTVVNAQLNCTNLLI
ncbi:hypothetical protein Ddc_01245 [Ditylenchus destructor]|nr:hypothetical protein Ddc_01245 [Ditylenchus destructor]